ncbi:MAG: hypothetical protein LBK58_13190 [Prevotellaceae bacterium]|jgi:hypothetical protein|nr:hypothetical protein [Prevotellaceae bacterium]
MDAKKILSWIALFIGEAIIIAAFILFRGSLTDSILVLDIIVSSIIYSLFFVDILVPWFDLGDKSQKKVGSLGLRWFFTLFYAFAAIATMLVCHSYDCSLETQILCHCVLIFFLILGFVASLHSSGKVRQVYQQETSNRKGILEMKKAVTNLKDRMSGLSGLPENVIDRISVLEESLRFISPSENAEAHSLEQQFVRVIDDISFAVSNYSMNEEAIASNLKKLERIYQNRKNIYSS